MVEPTRLTEAELERLLVAAARDEPSIADELTLVKRQEVQALVEEVRRLRAVEDMARQVWAFRCTCDADFVSLEQHEAHRLAFHVTSEARDAS